MPDIDQLSGPDCHGALDTCKYQEPHKHGFACDRTCTVCHGHYDNLKEQPDG